MPTRRDLFKQAGVRRRTPPSRSRRAPRTRRRRAHARHQVPIETGSIDPRALSSVLSSSIIGLIGEGLAVRESQTVELKPLPGGVVGGA